MGPTFGDLLLSDVLTFAQLQAAAEAYLIDQTRAVHSFGSGCDADFREIMRAHPSWLKALADPDETAAFKQTIVMTALVLAQPMTQSTLPAPLAAASRAATRPGPAIGP